MVAVDMVMSMMTEMMKGELFAEQPMRNLCGICSCSRSRKLGGNLCGDLELVLALL